MLEASKFKIWGEETANNKFSNNQGFFAMKIGLSPRIS
jgi:hypothetical protein